MSKLTSGTEYRGSSLTRDSDKILGGLHDISAEP